MPHGAERLDTELRARLDVSSHAARRAVRASNVPYTSFPTLSIPHWHASRTLYPRFHTPEAPNRLRSGLPPGASVVEARGSAPTLRALPPRMQTHSRTPCCMPKILAFQVSECSARGPRRAAGLQSLGEHITYAGDGRTKVRDHMCPAISRILARGALFC
ncbi:hypothetical protein B0H17DRAFT_1338356 [Mycena rosella]|uniref:Uncharacterized protein n=1 Tax=Mycena rosella TaxID=1033263 RepID=A0AAD7CMQ6_MYCRO|nr:hypothetical protein B0H17DRAFT_1338356 [Mycena rosella]